jgi:hypothetical protein
VSGCTEPLPEQHVWSLDGLPVASVARTVVDLAREATFLEAVTAADAALYRGLARKAELREVAVFCAGWTGMRKAQRALAFADPKAESPCESLARVVLHGGGIPPPDSQVLIGDEWFWYARVDFAWPASAPCWRPTAC